MSTWKKSTARIPDAWARKNCRQVGPARRGSRIDARSAQDLPDCRLRHRHAEFRQFAMDPAISPPRILLRQPYDKAGDAPDCRRAAERALPARVVFLRGQLTVPGEQCRWRDREDVAPAGARYEPGQRGEPHPVGRTVPDPAGVAAQRRVLVAEHEQFGILRPVAAGYQDSKAEYPAN